MSVFTVTISDASGNVGTDSSQTYTISITASGSGLASGLLVNISQSDEPTNTWSGTLQAQDSSGNWPADVTFNGGGSASVAMASEERRTASPALMGTTLLPCDVVVLSPNSPNPPLSQSTQVFLMVTEN